MTLPAAAALLDEAVDFNSQAFIDNPYPTYARLRAVEPYWLPHVQQNSTSPGMWLFSRYDDVSQILKESVAISKRLDRVRPPQNLMPLEQAMLNQDPPDHTRLRSLMNQAFTAERLRQLENMIADAVDGLIAGLSAQPDADFARDFAIPLPMQVIAHIMGIPFADHEIFGQWAGQILCGYDSGVKNTDNFAQYRGAIAAMGDYFGRLIEQRRRQPAGDLISALIEAHEKGDRLSGRELISMCMLLLVAGHETTTNMLSSGMLLLLRHPDQLGWLRAHPEGLPTAIEEMLRYESPAQRGTFRITVQEMTIGGRRLGAGEQISALLGAANRDPAQFPDPDRFDVRRTPNRHLAFGGGIHFCLGAMLARIEARIAFGRILERLPGLRLGERPPQWNDKKLFRGLRSLPVAV